jgi:hypothetical protein
MNTVKTDWMFLLDADERLTKALRQRIQSLITSTQYDSFSFPRKNFMLGNWMKHGMRWPDYQTRLFRKNAVRWPKAIHTQPIFDEAKRLSLPAVEKNAIVHHHVVSIRELAQKTLEQSSHEMFYAKQQHMTPELVRNRIENEFPWRFIEHQGKQDGVRGYLSAKFMEYYRFLEFAFYWEKHQDIFSTQKELERLTTIGMKNMTWKEKIDMIKKRSVHKLFKRIGK